MVCTFGSHIKRLDMPVCHGSYIRQKPMLHELDCVVGLDANIPPFGACVSPDNPNIEIIIESPVDVMPLANEEGGYSMPPMPITGRLCTPMLGPKWIDAHEDTLIDGVPALTVDCTIACLYQGVIFFIDDGQMDDRDDLASDQEEQELERKRARAAHAQKQGEALSWIVGGTGKAVAVAAKAAKTAKAGRKMGSRVSGSGVSNNATTGSGNTIKPANPEKVTNILKDFDGRYFSFGDKRILLDKSGMKHVLVRHHPEYWDGSIKRAQNYFDNNMDVNDVENAIQSVLYQNRDKILSRNSNSMYQIKGTYNGTEYTLGINRDRVAQFYPN